MTGILNYAALESELQGKPQTWLVTGCAGFIGSHLIEQLLRLGQRVRGVDNFSTGKQKNLELVRAAIGEKAWSQFQFSEGDIADASLMQKLCNGAGVILHQAALGSVPRSIKAPLDTNRANVDGFLTTLTAAKDAGIKRFVYASSSSVYGSDTTLPKREAVIGEQLSPYAVSKYVNELYARTFSHVYGIETVGLRYFNVFGPRQDPEGMYAAVMPRWIAALLRGEQCSIFGDGETSRDFCFIQNVVQANILAALNPLPQKAVVANIAVGGKTSLTALYQLIAEALVQEKALKTVPKAQYSDFRQGDIRHSQADLSTARSAFGYEPSVEIAAGIQRTVRWYLEQSKS